MQQENGYHMSLDDFRRNGAAALEWAVRYLDRLEELPVLPRVAPGVIRAALPPSPPLDGEPFDDLLADLDRVIVPGTTHWQSPNFFAFFPANSTAPSILGELVTAVLGVQGMMWITSPACTELETHVLDWVVQLLGLPKRFASGGEGGGVIQDSASSANLCALLAARDRATGGNVNHAGVRDRMTCYVSTETHSSVEKAARIAGIGGDNVRRVAVDGSLAMLPDDLERTIDADVARGATPFMVAATVGTTSTLAVDPLRAIGEICRRRGLWLHVDAAMAGTAAVCPEFRWVHDGLELADSYCFDPHKWMFTNFDCSAFYVADREWLVSALSIQPEYLRNPATEARAVIDYRDWHVPLGRRMRALKLWFVIRHYGINGLRHHIREHVELARRFAEWMRDDDRFEVLEPQHLTLVCFRHRAGDAATAALLDGINREGIYLTHTKVGGKMTMRMSIGQARTELRHVERAWAIIRKVAGEL